MLLRSCLRVPSAAIARRPALSVCDFATVSTVRVENTPSLKRSLGQHLLVNTSVLQSIVDAAEIQKSDHILEVGPGTGNLTLLLLGIAKRVTCVEYDHRMISQLEERFAAEIAAARLKIVHGDFAKMSMKSLPKFDMCVANIPYNISSPVVGQLLGKSPHPRFRGAVLMVQEEFALRLMATPGTKNYSRLSVNTSFQAEVTSVVKVPRKNFVPPPKVDSRVIKITLHDDQPPVHDLARLDTFLRIAFQRKNKTLRALLTSKFAAPFLRIAKDVASGKDPADVTKEIVLATLASLDLLDARAVKLTGHQFVTVLEALEKEGLTFVPSTFGTFDD
ncbi:dimethyladenosine transferase [Aphanomyces invadans]|uniref:rRNA adenine N(6)-methyltransferase n=1 Tax=Aphanomyces invadans TaxID=157072 RepID=A0A024UT48_9STRA|nr:dimethyladenosine transferase [Aphanomyces invadans]ETW09509.1 dimethyladenosine transferase [Aphanomyces invadans]|eukprot:XP_008860920.1 dimethyladenosine transferase [Aphanomyces invadans]